MVRQDLFDKGIVTKVSDLKGRKIAVRDSDYDLFNALAPGNFPAMMSKQWTWILHQLFPRLRIVPLMPAWLLNHISPRPRTMVQPLSWFPQMISYQTGPFRLLRPAILDKDPDLGRRFMIAYLRGVKHITKGKQTGTLRLWGIIHNSTGNC